MLQLVINRAPRDKYKSLCLGRRRPFHRHKCSCCLHINRQGTRLARPNRFGIKDAIFGGPARNTRTSEPHLRNQRATPELSPYNSCTAYHSLLDPRHLRSTTNTPPPLDYHVIEASIRIQNTNQKTVKLFSSALKRTLRSGASGLSIAAAASIQQKPVNQNKSASLLARSAERRMHSKVVSEFAPPQRFPEGCMLGLDNASVISAYTDSIE